MKSAYELALERLEERGIERPGDLDEATREQITAARSKADAELAKLQILHHDRMRQMADPQQARRAEEEYAIERQRIEERRDREVARLRGDG